MNLLRTLSAISSMTMLSRVAGLVRDTLFARAFGVSAYTDAFNAAFRLPNLLRRLFAEGAFSQAFVPILAEYKNQHGQPATKALVDHVATVLLWATIATALLGIAAAPALVWLIGSKMQAAPFEAAVWMTRLMFPYIACMSFVALAGGILNTWSQFKIPAFTPVLYNVAAIGAILLLQQHLAQPVYAMAIGVVVGGLLQVGFQIPALVRIGMLPSLSLKPVIAMRDPGVRRVLRKMAPAVFAVSAAQISLLINTSIANMLATGSLSALTYADRLMEFPTALLGVALGTILLPSLAKANLDGDGGEYSSLLDWGLRLTFLLTLPAAVGMATLATPLIATLFHYGQFNAQAVSMSSAPLIAYSIGLIGIILVKTLTPAFYARQDVRTPVRIALGVLVATQLMNLAFVPLFKVAGLALSIGVGACINALFLYVLLRRRAIFVPLVGWPIFLVKLAVALGVMAALTLALSAQFDWLGMQAHPLLRVAALLLTIASSMVCYFGVLFVLGFRINDFRRTTR